MQRWLQSGGGVQCMECTLSNWKSETSRSHLITRWVGWRFGIVHMLDLRKGLSSSDLAGRITYV